MEHMGIVLDCLYKAAPDTHTQNPIIFRHLLNNTCTDMEILILYVIFLSQTFPELLFFFSVPSSDCCDSSLVAQIVTKVKELGKI